MDSHHNDATTVRRPPAVAYDIRLHDGTTYHATGSYFESGDGWFTLWHDDLTVVIRVPEAHLAVFVRAGTPCTPGADATASH